MSKIHNQMHYKRFENCIPVKGGIRSVICDLQRGNFDFIPNVLFDILSKDYFSVNSLLNEYGKENEETIIEYIDFLIEKEYCFKLDLEEVCRFPKLGLQWEIPHIISNAILEIDNIELDNLNKAIFELTELGCKNLELKAYKNHDFVFYENILKLFESTIITNIDLFAKYDLTIFNKEICLKIISKFYRLGNVFLHSAPETKFEKTQSSTKLFFSNEKLNGHEHCGKISPIYFSVNLETFTESQKHNTCLNRKISIDVNGEIKNCPSMAKSYGNIKDTTLKKAIEKSGFKDLWFIHKDQIEVCKDCEFRHICTDCRAYIKDPNNIYSKPAKCSYDPYTATWREENPTNNPLYGQ